MKEETKIISEIESETIECELCSKPAYLFCRWGLDGIFIPDINKNGVVTQSHLLSYRTEPYHEANLCKIHAEELWSSCKGSVNSGLMSWWNLPPKNYN